jgi:hypothetical protein
VSSKSLSTPIPPLAPSILAKSISPTVSTASASIQSIPQARRGPLVQARRRTNGSTSAPAPDGQGRLACTATETVADLASTRLNWDAAAPHRLNADANTSPDAKGTTIVPASRTPVPFPASTLEPPPRLQRCRRLRRTPLAEFDVYMDDYLGKDSATTIKYLLRLSTTAAGERRYAAAAIVVVLDGRATNIQTKGAALQ